MRIKNKKQTGSRKVNSIDFCVNMGYSVFSVEATERVMGDGMTRHMSSLNIDACGDAAYLEECVRDYVRSLAYFTDPLITITAQFLGDRHKSFPMTIYI